MKWLAERGWYLWYEDGVEIGSEKNTEPGWCFTKRELRNSSLKERKSTIQEAVKFKLKELANHEQAKRRDSENKLESSTKTYDEIKALI